METPKHYLESTMPLNPIEEIRAIRKKLMREFDNDFDKLCDHVEAAAKAEGRIYVKSEPSRITPKKTASRATAKKKSTKPKASTRGRRSA